MVPADEGEVVDTYTSGSTGTPIHLKKSARHFEENSRELRRLRRSWNFWRFSRVVHATDPTPGSRGKIEEGGGPDRKRWTIYSNDAAAILPLLIEHRAELFNAFASTAWAVLENAPDLPALRLVATIGEIVPDALRQLIASRPNCRLMDQYGSRETGIMAVECPTCGEYHVADRQLILEVLDEAGAPCPPGAIGRVVVTPLFGHAMPLIRYAIGDYAVPGRASACAGGTTLTRIVGKDKALFTLPSGTKISPYLPSEDMTALGVKRFKLVQHTVHDVELLYIPANAGVCLDQATVGRLARECLSPDFTIRLTVVDDLPRGPGGKYLLHESRVTDC